MEKIKKSTLYLVGTPIGNLGDMSPRGLNILKSVDVVAAEDTRHTLELLNHFDIKNTLVRYDEHTKETQGEYLLNLLQQGKSVACVSDAGLPGISDPGADLAKKAIDLGIEIVPVPGANAALSALIASGLPTQPFFFGGFLPKSSKNRKEQLEVWKSIPATLILYEAPHHIKEVLVDVYKIFGNRKTCIAREITKLHEEFWRGNLDDAIKFLQEQEQIRGEFVVVFAPPEQKETNLITIDEMLSEVASLIEQGENKKDALVEVAKKYKASKRILYNAWEERVK